MKIEGEVTGQADESRINACGTEMVSVRIKILTEPSGMHNTDSMSLSMTQSAAKHYPIGRRVRITIKPT